MAKTDRTLSDSDIKAIANQFYRHTENIWIHDRALAQSKFQEVLCELGPLTVEEKHRLLQAVMERASN